MANKPAFLSSTLRFAALMATGLALSQAYAAGDVNANGAATQASAVTAPYHPTVDNSPANAPVTQADLQQLQKESRQNASELASLKETITAQSLVIDDLKNGPTPAQSTQPANTDVAALKGKMDEQSRTISALQTQLNDIKRGASGASTDSNASEISSLKQEISNLRSSVGRLESQVSSLSSKVK